MNIERNEIKNEDGLKRVALIASFGVQDGKGRKIGGFVWISERSDGTVDWETASARDGARFGALRPTHNVKTLADAERDARRALERMNKAALKNLAFTRVVE